MKSHFITRAGVEELILILSFMAAFLLLQLPFEEVNGNPVPKVVFSKRPTCFHTYLLALNFAFTGAAMTMSLRDKCPKAAAHCRRLACLAAAAAVGALAWSVAAASLGPVHFPVSQVAESSWGFEFTGKIEENER
ncbi:hypothetical protein BT93_L5081 [Corymbia citriodora subsp. variegata]|uniref:Uncharacterized protein n=1 Tax=Corymbia citriodora subsp. variegata TaxID=360336 RepID=A0A8T0CVE6_CORYI|nr:hypothetical protein BT93_L5081 [Corymbia citriodora subsp. variegata]